MARRATAIDNQRAANANVLLVDSGSTLLGDDLANRTQGKIVMEAMSKLGYAAMAVGASDLAQGREVLLARAKEATFPVVSANLLDAASQQLLLPPYAIVEMEGRKIAIVGLTSPDEMRADQQLDLTVGDPMAAARSTIAELKDRASVVIVLSRLDSDLNRRLASEVPGVAAVVGGRAYMPDGRVWVAPETGTVVVNPGSRGEHLGVLRLHLDGQGKPMSATWEPIRLSNAIAADPDLQALVDRYAGQQ